MIEVSAVKRTDKVGRTTRYEENIIGNPERPHDATSCRDYPERTKSRRNDYRQHMALEREDAQWCCWDE